MNKVEMLINLFEDTANCTRCEKFNGKSQNDEKNGLINIFCNKEMWLNILSIWTDWLNRSNCKLMIVGQDWGPFVDMEKLHIKYYTSVEDGKDKELAWANIVNEPESMTKKMMTEFIIQSAKQMDITVDESILNSFFITNAVLCARRGNNYRGNDNFKPKFCTENCAEKLRKEIEIIRPLVVITLGYWPFYSIAKSFGIPVFKTLKENLKEYSSDINKIINISDTQSPMYVLPVYHPTAQVRKNDQIAYYRLLWKLLLTQFDKNEVLKIIKSYNNYRGELKL